MGAGREEAGAVDLATGYADMTRTVCSEYGCPEFAEHRGKCAAHRETTSQRGYGVPHQEARARLGALLPLPCAYGCGTILHAGSAWVAAHVIDGDDSKGWVAACVTCNERAKQPNGPSITHPVTKISRSALPPPDPPALFSRRTGSQTSPDVELFA